MGKKVYSVAAGKNTQKNYFIQTNAETKKFKRSRSMNFDQQGEIIKSSLRAIYPEYSDYIKLINFSGLNYNNAGILNSFSQKYSPDSYGETKFDESNYERYALLLKNDFKNDIPMAEDKANAFFELLYKDGNLTSFMTNAIAYAKEDDKLMKYWTANVPEYDDFEIVNSTSPVDINQAVKASKAVADILDKSDLFGEIEDSTLLQYETSTDGIMITAPGMISSSQEIKEKLFVPGKKLNEETGEMEDVINNKCRDFNGTSIEKLSDIVVMDLLTGNISGYSGDCFNMELNENNQLESITRTDISHNGLFPSELNKDNIKASIDSIGVISTKTADKIMKLEEDKYKEQLSKYNLSDSQIDTAWKMVDSLKFAIIRGKMHYKDKEEGILDKGQLRVTDNFDKYSLEKLSKLSDDTIYSGLYKGSLFEEGESYINASHLQKTVLVNKEEFVFSDIIEKTLNNHKYDKNGNIAEDSDLYKAITSNIKNIRYCKKKDYAAGLNNLAASCQNYITERKSIFHRSAGKERFELVSKLLDEVKEQQFEFANKEKIAGLTNMMLINMGVHPKDIGAEVLGEDRISNIRKKAIDIIKKMPEDRTEFDNVLNEFLDNEKDMIDLPDGFIWKDYENSSNKKNYIEYTTKALKDIYSMSTKMSADLSKDIKEKIQLLPSGSMPFSLSYTAKNTNIKDSDDTNKQQSIYFCSSTSNKLLKNGGGGTKITRANSIITNAMAFYAMNHQMSLEDAYNACLVPSKENMMQKEYLEFLQENPIEGKELSKEELSKSIKNHAMMFKNWYKLINETKIQGFETLLSPNAKSNIDFFTVMSINISQNEEMYNSHPEYYQFFDDNYREDMTPEEKAVCRENGKKIHNELKGITFKAQLLGIVKDMLKEYSLNDRASRKMYYDFLMENSGGIDGKSVNELNSPIIDNIKYVSFITEAMKQINKFPQDMLENYVSGNAISDEQAKQLKDFRTAKMRELTPLFDDYVSKEFAQIVKDVKDSIPEEGASKESKVAEDVQKESVSFKELVGDELPASRKRSNSITGPSKSADPKKAL